MFYAPQNKISTKKAKVLSQFWAEAAKQAYGNSFKIRAYLKHGNTDGLTFNLSYQIAGQPIDIQSYADQLLTP